MSTSVVNQLRQPGYREETRCIPRTATKVITPAVFGLLAASMWLVIAGSFAWVMSSTVVAVGLVVIWLQAYLAPETPELTKQYFPDWILRRFDNHPVSRIRAAEPGDDGGTDGDRDDDETLAEENGDGPDQPTRSEAEAWLSAARVIVPCEQENDLCLNEQFRTGWYDRIQTIRDNETVRDELAEEFDLSPMSIEFEDQDDSFIAHSDSQKVGHWRSRAAMVADIAAVRELPDWVDGWDNLSSGLRRNLLFTLRIFLDVCPLCDESVEIGTETLDSGSQSTKVFAGTCEGCGAYLFEMPSPEST